MFFQQFTLEFYAAQCTAQIVVKVFTQIIPDNNLLHFFLLAVTVDVKKQKHTYQ